MSTENVERMFPGTKEVTIITFPQPETPNAQVPDPNKLISPSSAVADGGLDRTIDSKKEHNKK